jgi:hypothetical protein
MLTHKILADPVDKVVFKYTLDELMEEVWGYQLMDIRTREILGEGLGRW